jgi:uncharacterized protein YdeI (YjbR/CyaY-like superfamily)
MDVKIFVTPAEFRAWLERNHNQVAELWLGLYNKRGSKTSITYAEALDEALCFGWIDGVRKSVDRTTYAIRFTPRKPRSYWSTVNLKHATRLKKLGQMAQPGLAALESRSVESGKYSFENRPSTLDPALEKQFKANQQAWKFFNSQAPWYQRTSIFWVMSAKKEETRLKRLATLINDSEKNRRLGILTPKAKKSH